MKEMKYNFIVYIFVLIQSIFTLPFIQEAETKTIQNDQIQVDRLADVIATHLQFDHLDTVIRNVDDFIATEFQHHLQVSIQNEGNAVSMQQLPTLDMMDLEILKSQIFAAIHAHTEGNLPLYWNTNTLSKQSISSFIRQLIINTCTYNQDTMTVSSICLEQNAPLLSQELNLYIQQNLETLLDILDRDILPHLLEHTAKDLKNILYYFNSAFLQDQNREFVLEVVPWNSDPNDIHDFKSKLLDLAIHPTSCDNTDNSHSTMFFIEYASMATV